MRSARFAYTLCFLCFRCASIVSVKARRAALMLKIRRSVDDNGFVENAIRRLYHDECLYSI